MAQPTETIGPAADDAKRFESIYRACYGAVHAYARRRLPERADDVTAETFLVAWRRLDQVPDDPLPWLYGVAGRVGADLRRTARRQERLARRVAGLAEPEGPVPELPDRELRAALMALPAADRELLFLVYWEDLEPVRAARALGCSRATVATRLWRARRRLQAQLERAGGGTR